MFIVVMDEDDSNSSSPLILSNHSENSVSLVIYICDSCNFVACDLWYFESRIGSQKWDSIPGPPDYKSTTVPLGHRTAH